jgi:hypothetical protein
MGVHSRGQGGLCFQQHVHAHLGVMCISRFHQFEHVILHSAACLLQGLFAGASQACTAGADSVGR